MNDQLNALMRDDHHVTILFGKSTTHEGQVSCLRMTTGVGQTIVGHGVTPGDALEDVVRQFTPTPRPALPGLAKLPGL